MLTPLLSRFADMAESAETAERGSDTGVRTAIGIDAGAASAL